MISRLVSLAFAILCMTTLALLVFPSSNDDPERLRSQTSTRRPHNRLEVHQESRTNVNTNCSSTSAKLDKIDRKRRPIDQVPDWLMDAAKRVRNPYKGCQELYPKLDRQNPYDEEYMVEVKAHNKTYWKNPFILRHFDQKKKEPDGYSFKCCPAQVLMMMDLARIPWVKTICEVGFNAGHSALSWLAAKPGTKLYAFDIGYHGYTKPMAEYLKQRFPGRLELILGDSSVSLPNFIRNNPDVKCDLMSIDGGHYYKYAIHDFNNFRKMANPVNLLHFDDYPMGDHPIRAQDLGRVWEEKLENGQLTEIFRCSFFKDNKNLIGMKGFTVGQINI